ncbi:MAG: Rossmann-like domain-containing protein [Granulosicoccaceae bacterium]
MSPIDLELSELGLRIDAALGELKIAGFHFPTATDPQSLKGEFCVVKLEGGGSGLSYTLAQDHGFDRSAFPMPQAGDLAIDWVMRFGAPPNQIPGPQRAAALATINALYNALLRRTNTLLPPADNSFGLSDIQRGDKVGMIGFFPPLVKRLRSLQVDLTVIELRRDLEREHPGLTVTTDRRRLAPCTKVLCTSTTLLNQTLPDMIAAAPNAREFSLLGPSAGCPPDALFAVGVSTLASAQITDDDTLWQRLVNGEKLGDARRKCTITTNSIPSTLSLIESL